MTVSTSASDRGYPDGEAVHELLKPRDLGQRALAGAHDNDVAVELLRDGFDDLGRGSLLDVGGPLHAIGIDPKCLDGFDVARAVVALVRTHLFEPIFAKQRSMSMDGRQQRGLVLHTHVGTGEGDHEVSPDASQLEHAPKLMGLADLALFPQERPMH